MSKNGDIKKLLINLKKTFNKMDYKLLLIAIKNWKNQNNKRILKNILIIYKIITLFIEMFFIHPNRDAHKEVVWPTRFLLIMDDISTTWIKTKTHIQKLL